MLGLFLSHSIIVHFSRRIFAFLCHGENRDNRHNRWKSSQSVGFENSCRRYWWLFWNYKWQKWPLNLIIIRRWKKNSKLFFEILECSFRIYPYPQTQTHQYAQGFRFSSPTKFGDLVCFPWKRSCNVDKGFFTIVKDIGTYRTRNQTPHIHMSSKYLPEAQTHTRYLIINKLCEIEQKLTRAICFQTNFSQA